MWEIVRREFIYFWYYFTLQFRQIFGYWVIGMLVGSLISVFFKDKIHNMMRSMKGATIGILGIVLHQSSELRLRFACTERFL